MKLNSEIRSSASDALKEKWIMGAIATFISLAISTTVSSLPFIGALLSILICIPLSWGIYILFLDVYNGADININTLFVGFKDYGRVLGTLFLMNLYTFLWSLLLIIPGIMKHYSYAQTSFILKDHPELQYNEAIEKSISMMSGYKMKLFLLDLSFIGWALLSIITLGLGFFLLFPYVYTSHAAFYEDLKVELGEATPSMRMD